MAFAHSEKHLRRQPDLLGLPVVGLALLLRCGQLWVHDGASNSDSAIFLLLLLVGLVLCHLGRNHVAHQARVPVLALRDRWHVTLLRVVKQCLWGLLSVVWHTRRKTLLGNWLADTTV